MAAKTLKQIYDESITSAKLTVPKLIHRGALYKWKGCASSFVIGELKFDGLPHFSLNVFDESHVLPCILLNPSKNAKKILKLYGHVVLLKEPELVVEIFVSGDLEYSLVHVLLDADKIHVIERSIHSFSIALKESRNISDQNSNSIESEWRQIFVPLKISSTLLTLKCEVFCFVLVSLVDSDKSDNTEHLVWFILRNKQVIWKDLLLPTYIYHVVLPDNIPQSYFSTFNSLISIIDENMDVTFHQILHHKDLTRTNAALFLPDESKIYSSFHTSRIPRNIEKWYSISDMKLKFLKFASIYGVIKEVKYFDSFKTKNCIWCCCGNGIFESTLKEPATKSENASNCDLNHLMSMSQDDEEMQIVFLPNVSFDIPKDKRINGFGVRGGKVCIQITLQNCFSEDIASVFIKRWQLQQYPVGLVRGISVCFTDVNIRRSNANKYYFICTPFTRILHLNSNSNERKLPCIGFSMNVKFGFPFTQPVTEKVWGILELDLPLKISLSTKCKSCNRSFLHYSCSNAFCPKFQVSVGSNGETVASARLLVHNFKGSQMSTLYLKNETVQQYLSIPHRIWRHLCNLSANAELIYLHQRTESEPNNRDPIDVFFHSYCKYFRPKKRFHVLCKQFKDDVSRFFCLELAEITEERLAFARSSFQIERENKNRPNI